MTESTQKIKKISRRDAIKLLGAAAGATVLANLPSKWSTPELSSGVLPAHAQTSVVVSYSITCDGDTSFQSSPFNGNIGVTVSPNVAGIEMDLLVLGNYNPLEQTVDITGVPANPILTGLGGVISIPITITVTPITANSGSVQFYWTSPDPNFVFQSCTQEISWSGIPIPTLPTVTTDAVVEITPNQPVFNFFGTVTSEGSSPVTVRGFVWGSSPNPTLPSPSSNIAAGGGLGAFSVLNQFVLPAGPYHLRAYATSAVGTAYGGDIPFTSNVCLAEGTLITLANGTLKKIEDIEASDWLAVWNFDEGKFDAAQPLWIKKAEIASQYNLLEFSDGSSLKTISQHRIFNKKMGAFTYPMTEDTPIGTTTFNVKGEEVTLVNKSVVKEQVNYYNVITHRHMNLFANGILTSCRYNNIYPIVDMKFVKDNRAFISREEYEVEDKYFEGLRLAEQTIPVADTNAYVNRLEALRAEQIEVEPIVIA